MTQKKKILSGSVYCECPSNIALVKYWGKYENQIPANPSLSMTLSRSVTKMKIDFIYQENLNEANIIFKFEGSDNKKFEEKLRGMISRLGDLLPAIQKCQLFIESENTFPHSAGIASSASSMAALAFNLYNINAEITNKFEDDQLRLRRISEIARLFSGSASRSVYGGWVSWGKIDDLTQTSDLFASPLNIEIHPVFRSLKDFILVVDKSEKLISSSAGHQLMKNHPFAEARYQMAKQNLNTLLRVLQTGDFEDFITVVENEALTLHGLMMQSVPGYFLMKPETLMILQHIRNFRERKKIPLCFTLDAGPNIHLLFSENVENEIEYLLKEISDLCSRIEVIKDGIGQGPVLKNKQQNG